MIEVRGIAKSYGPLKAVVDLDLSVPAGEVFGFLGPNGAGKTTTIRMMVGLVRPSAGSIRLCDHDIEKEPEKAKALLGYVPDRPFLYEKLTGLEFLSFVGSLYGIARQDALRAARPTLQLLDMEEHVHRLIEGFSHGMRQKLMIAASLVHDPRVYIVDEPMVGLDPRSARTIRQMLDGMRRRGMAVFLSTHTLSVAEAVCDRIGIIHRGRVVAMGTMKELKERARLPGSTLEEVFLRLTEESDSQGPTAPGGESNPG